MIKSYVYIILVIAFCFTGCGSLSETCKTIWGSSTRKLEEARVDAITKTYKCSYDDCFDVILTLDRNNKNNLPINKKCFEIFLKDRVKGCIVVMGIKGNIKTTEVGIFLSDKRDGFIKLEISSLSSTAKEKVAEWVFKELGSHFRVVE